MIFNCNILVLGEFASAIETLVTAISLIKQSRIANDDRCKILISSLQDTLHGIESKSYGSK
jgi:cleavage and polyadenylation specificity factor subunit 6/7